MVGALDDRAPPMPTTQKKVFSETESGLPVWKDVPRIYSLSDKGCIRYGTWIFSF
jgi:hypothetical protein